MLAGTKGLIFYRIRDTFFCHRGCGPSERKQVKLNQFPLVSIQFKFNSYCKFNSVQLNQIQLTSIKRYKKLNQN